MFDLDIVSSPGAALFPEAKMWSVEMRSLREYDEDLVKPAILFADSIKLWSERVDMIDATTSRAFAVSRMPMRIIYNYLGLSRRSNPDEIRALGIEPGVLVSREEASVFFSEHGNTPTDHFGVLQAFAKEHESRISDVTDATLEFLNVRHEELKSNALKDLEEEGILSISGWADGRNDPWSLAWEDETTFFTRIFIDVLSQLSQSHNALLLEPGSAFFLSGPDREATRQGKKRTAPTRQTVKRAVTPSSVAFSMVGRLPGLNEVLISDLVEIRHELHDYLAPFRAEAAAIAESFSGESLSPEDVRRVLSEEWHKKISPILSELDFKVQRGGYPRQLLSAFSEDKTALTSTAASVVLAGGTLVAGLGALIPAVAAASVPFVKAWNNTLRARDDVRDNRLYFLYEAKNRLGRLTGALA